MLLDIVVFQAIFQRKTANTMAKWKKYIKKKQQKKTTKNKKQNKQTNK
jgi:hypothetical protein